jgi:hypothetical protein
MGKKKTPPAPPKARTPIDDIEEQGILRAATLVMAPFGVADDILAQNARLNRAYPAGRHGSPGHDGDPVEQVELRDIEHRDKRKVTAEIRIDPLGWMLKHEDIQRYQFDAGRALQDDFEGIKIGGGSVSLESGGRGSISGLSDATCEAMRRFKDAIECVPPRAVTTVWHILLNRFTANKLAGIEHADRRAICERLQFGLDALALHYGLINRRGLERVGHR